MDSSKALKKLISGNVKYINAKYNSGDISAEIRSDTAHNGQHPYAVIISCSDSRVIPESIFSAGIGELFVIRVAGNVLDNHQLGSIEYAISHLGCKLIVVLGHTHCGAVDAAIHHDPSGHIKFITDEIRAAIADETDPYRACRLNVERNVGIIKRDLNIQEADYNGIYVAGAIYDIETGKVEFLNKSI